MVTPRGAESPLAQARDSETRRQMLEILRAVKDPELPMIDVVELGIVRDVVFEGEAIRVDVTPTYSGCPAIQVIEREIVATLESHGFKERPDQNCLFTCVDNRLAE
jgi:Predicted metal-sulfur cluster biosynthetic enzyme